MTEYTKEKPWRDSDGTDSLCIGCDFNVLEEWPDSTFGEFPCSDGSKAKITRDMIFPKVNFVCQNPKSHMYKKCIIGFTGCDQTSLKDN